MNGVTKPVDLMPFEKSMSVLKRYGVPFVEYQLSQNEDECVRFLSRVGYSVAMKLMSSELVHKSDVGGVLTGISNETDVRNGYRKLHDLGTRLRVQFEGVLIQKMISGFEMIVGGRIDEQFGGLIIVGFGGIYTEIYKDISIRVAPVDDHEAAAMLRELTAYKALVGFRGKRANLGELSKVVVNASHLMAKENIREMDLNPVMVNENDALPVDVRMIL
jgi:acetyl-CoA synthetase (ADP-forming)